MNDDNLWDSPAAIELVDGMRGELLPVTRPWADYPLGTKAHAVTGGWWCHVLTGWKWNGPGGNGGTFPTPGGDACGKCVELPPFRRYPVTDACYVRAGMTLASQVDELDACCRKLEDQLQLDRIRIEEQAKEINRAKDEAARQFNKVQNLTRKCADLEEELREAEKDFMCLASRLDGHDAAECRANLTRMLEEHTRMRDALLVLSTAVNNNPLLAERFEREVREVAAAALGLPPNSGARFMVEALFTYGWDDAGWTEDAGGGERPLRFSSRAEAEDAIAEHVEDVRAAVKKGFMESEEDPRLYRVVEAPRT